MFPLPSGCVVADHQLLDVLAAAQQQVALQAPEQLAPRMMMPKMPGEHMAHQGLTKPWPA